ncbi:unnamed protein product [Angiostrongylus costaricensis]|uniref:C2H2-type domain-containing protein n=1 Tax=Angiostrongylus costaricensis TaxID=334426 RepID=A0A0R3PKU6_ANGCS|nr:unnamed protein product [Angiostrongylus costaricensis]
MVSSQTSWLPGTDVPERWKAFEFRFSRFREKTFMCDVCGAAFTLKQNVQSHLFIYHVKDDGSMKQHTRLIYKCDCCEKVFSLNLSFSLPCNDIKRNSLKTIRCYALD